MISACHISSPIKQNDGVYFIPLWKWKNNLLFKTLVSFFPLQILFLQTFGANIKIQIPNVLPNQANLFVDNVPVGVRSEGFVIWQGLLTVAAQVAVLFVLQVKSALVHLSVIRRTDFRWGGFCFLWMGTLIKLILILLA